MQPPLWWPVVACGGSHHLTVVAVAFFFPVFRPNEITNYTHTFLISKGIQHLPVVGGDDNSTLATINRGLRCQPAWSAAMVVLHGSYSTEAQTYEHNITSGQ